MFRIRPFGLFEKETWMSLLDMPDEEELKRLVGTKPYWDQRHPDHRRVYQTVTDGYRRLYPSGNDGKIPFKEPAMPTDAAFLANLERGRQWLRNGGYQSMAQAQQREAERPNETPKRPAFEIPVKRPIPDVGPNGPLEEGMGWLMRQRRDALEWLGLPDPDRRHRPPGPGGTKG